MRGVFVEGGFVLKTHVQKQQARNVPSPGKMQVHCTVGTIWFKRCVLGDVVAEMRLGAVVGIGVTFAHGPGGSQTRRII